ncbi:TPA: multidrug transporter MdfA, partial [Legionella pneumophila]|nr:multidrug transporter MdfA [Legionella pneumophila]
ISLSIMIIGAIGIEIANLFYQHHNNLHFALYCNVVGLLFLIFIGLTFFTGTPKKSDIHDEASSNISNP